MKATLKSPKEPNKKISDGKKGISKFEKIKAKPNNNVKKEIPINISLNCLRSSFMK